MTLAGDTVFVAGPPDLMDEEYTFERIMEEDAAVNSLLEQQDAALAGKEGGTLVGVSVGDGSPRHEIKLDALPVWDGMAVANGSLFVATEDGSVVRFGSE